MSEDVGCLGFGGCVSRVREDMVVTSSGGRGCYFFVWTQTQTQTQTIGGDVSNGVDDTPGHRPFAKKRCKMACAKPFATDDAKRDAKKTRMNDIPEMQNATLEQCKIQFPTIFCKLQ